MKLKYSFETIEMNDEIICIPIGVGAELVHGVLKLNTSGKQIFDLLKEETDVGSIVKKISGEYDNDQYEIDGYVRSVIDKLCKAGLIEG